MSQVPNMSPVPENMNDNVNNSNETNENKLEEELENQKRSIKVLKGRMIDTKDVLDLLKVGKSSIVSKNAQVERLEKEVARLKEEYKKLGQEQEKERTKFKNTSEASIQAIQIFANRIKVLDAEKTSFKAQLEKAQQHSSSSATAAANTQQINTNVNILEAKIKSLESEKSQLEADKSRVEAEKCQVKSDQDKVKAELSSKKMYILQLEAKCQSLEDENKSAKKKVEPTATPTNKKTKQELVKKDQEINQLKSENTNLNTQVVSLKDSLAELEKQVADLEEQNGDLLDENMELRIDTSMEVDDEDTGSSKQQQGSVAAAADKLQEELERVKEQNIQLQAALLGKDHDLSRLRNEMGQIQSRSQGLLDKKEADLSATKDQLVKAHSTLRSVSSTKYAEITRLQAQLKEAQQSISQLQVAKKSSSTASTINSGSSSPKQHRSSSSSAPTVKYDEKILNKLKQSVFKISKLQQRNNDLKQENDQLRKTVIDLQSVDALLESFSPSASSGEEEAIVGIEDEDNELMDYTTTGATSLMANPAANEVKHPAKVALPVIASPASGAPRSLASLSHEDEPRSLAGISQENAPRSLASISTGSTERVRSEVSLEFKSPTSPTRRGSLSPQWPLVEEIFSSSPPPTTTTTRNKKSLSVEVIAIDEEETSVHPTASARRDSNASMSSTSSASSHRSTISHKSRNNSSQMSPSLPNSHRSQINSGHISPTSPTGSIGSVSVQIIRNNFGHMSPLQLPLQVPSSAKDQMVERAPTFGNSGLIAPPSNIKPKPASGSTRKIVKAKGVKRDSKIFKMVNSSKPSRYTNNNPIPLNTKKTSSAPSSVSSTVPTSPVSSNTAPSSPVRPTAPTSPISSIIAPTSAISSITAPTSPASSVAPTSPVSKSPVPSGKRSLSLTGSEHGVGSPKAAAFIAGVNEENNKKHKVASNCIKEIESWIKNGNVKEQDPITIMHLGKYLKEISHEYRHIKSVMDPILKDKLDKVGGKNDFHIHVPSVYDKREKTYAWYLSYASIQNDGNFDYIMKELTQEIIQGSKSKKLEAVNIRFVRLACMICKSKGDMDTLKKLIYDIIRNSSCPSNVIFSLLNIANCWKECLVINDESDILARAVQLCASSIAQQANAPEINKFSYAKLANVVNWPVAEVAMPAQEFVDDTFSKFETVDLAVNKHDFIKAFEIVYFTLDNWNDLYSNLIVKKLWNLLDVDGLKEIALESIATLSCLGISRNPLVADKPGVDFLRGMLEDVVQAASVDDFEEQRLKAIAEDGLKMMDGARI